MEQNKKNKMKEVAKAFGINLDNMEQINVNGKSFFKFVDPETNELRMLENIEYDNMSEQFKKTQEKLSFAQSVNGVENARMIFDYEQKHNKTLLQFMPLQSLCIVQNGKIYVTEVYQKLTDGLSVQKKNEINYLLQVSIALNLKSINIEYSIGIDNNNNVIGAKFNETTNQCEIEKATVLKFENDKKIVDENNYEVEIENIDFDNLLSQIEVSNDSPIEISGEQIKRSDIEKYYEYPELIERESMSQKRRMIINRLLETYKKRLELQKEKAPKEKQMILLKRNDGFANEMLFALVVGFTSGVILALFLFTIRGTL